MGALLLAAVVPEDPSRRTRVPEDTGPAEEPDGRSAATADLPVVPPNVVMLQAVLSDALTELAVRQAVTHTLSKVVEVVQPVDVNGHRAVSFASWRTRVCVSGEAFCAPDRYLFTVR